MSVKGLIPRFVAGLALLMPLPGAAAQSGSDYVTGFPREAVHVQAWQGGNKSQSRKLHLPRGYSVKSEPGPPTTLEGAAAARVRFISGASPSGSQLR